MHVHLNRTFRGGQQVLVCVLSAFALFGLSACSSSGGTSNVAGGPANLAAQAVVSTPDGHSGASGTATVAPGASPSDNPTVQPKDLPKQPPGVSLEKPKDPLAPTTVTLVDRDGKKPRPSVKTQAGMQPFTKPVKYTDGLKLMVTDINQGAMSGQGPGVYPGRPTSTFHLSLVNGTSKPITLGVVVVTLTYGSPDRVAHHIYDSNSVDFSGVIKPGGAAKAVYGFSVPPKDLGDVTMTVDIDGVHYLANFTGSVKQP